MNPSNFNHHFLFFKKKLMQRGFNQNSFLQLKSNWKRNGLYLFSSTVVERNKNTATMKAWQASSYGFEHLKLSSVDIPSILKPNEVLVKVSAASVNPLDVAVIGKGYGKSALNFLSLIGDFNDIIQRPKFPLSGGRDFVGEVVRVGHSVSDIQVNDKVWGVVLPQNQGSHAEYVVTYDFLVSKKPENLSDVEAASIPYIGMTAWSALFNFGGLNPRSCKGMRIGLLGANGGIGTFLTQFLSVRGAEVSAICRKDLFSSVESCGASEVFDIEDPNTLEILTSNPKFHFFIDAAGVPTHNWCKTLIVKSKNPTLITLKSPVLMNMDENGVIKGAAKSLAEIIKINSEVVPSGVTIKWAFFFPSKDALKQIGELMKEGKIRPIIDKVFKMEDLIPAYEHVKDGRKKGKTVINFKS